MTINTQLEQSGLKTAADRLTRADTPGAGLYTHARPIENIVRIILFSCAVVSILTTFGIIYVLGSEALSFFTRYGFTNSNQSTTAVIDAAQTTIAVTGVGAQITVDQIIRIGEEYMRVLRVYSPQSLEVERGALYTSALAHPSGETVFLGEQVTFAEFLTGTRWIPQAADFGVLPLVLATVVTSIIALSIAGPLGLAAAIYLSEYASSRVRSILKPVLEVLAAIPTVVYGYFALTFITPTLRSIFGDVIGAYNMLAAGLAMGIMIIPTIASISEDALSAVPRSLREGSYGLGATRLETVSKVLLPAALSGLLAAFILGISRAFGETMIVAVASGAGPRFSLDPFQAAETMTGHIARISTGDISFGTVDYNSLFAIGLLLFLITLGLNLASNTIRRRFREVYQ
jgi:phosphate transport system permease protein